MSEEIGEEIAAKMQQNDQPDAIDQIIAKNAVLQPVHRRLIQDRKHLCEVANIPEQFLFRSAKGVLTESETAYLTKYREATENGCAGFVYGSTPSGAAILQRMQLMIAVFMRNFLDARLITTNEIVSEMAKGVEPEGRILFVPNFWDGWKADKGGAIFRAEKLSEFLVNRQIAGRSTVIQLTGKNTDFGMVFGDAAVQAIGTYAPFEEDA